MSSDVVIRAEGLGKKYMIGHQSGERYTSLRDVMARAARNLARTAGDMFRGNAIIAGDEVEEFWALKDVSFEIKRGDVVGIIGRNGAGKSTLLKVLSRITEPSEGRVEIKGRVASLLEVGTGFHPELTGRENIYLNGAILGMSREEIKRKFDEIVDFSGVEKFLDTPVKRYSSGMYVRLAFAVAAHLEPEILIVDEVLAVGDAEFQKKCLGKMKDVAGQGRTVLFVSHNLGAIQQLTSTALLMNAGTIIYSAPSDQAIARYAAEFSRPLSGWQDVQDKPRSYGNGQVLAQRARAYYLQNRDRGNPSLVIEVIAGVIEAIDEIRISFTIFKADGTPIGSGFSQRIFMGFSAYSTVQLSATINDVCLSSGLYMVGFSLGKGTATAGYVDYDVVMDAISFEIDTSYISGEAVQAWHNSWGPVMYPTITIKASNVFAPSAF